MLQPAIMLEQERRRHYEERGKGAAEAVPGNAVGRVVTYRWDLAWLQIYCPAAGWIVIDLASSDRTSHRICIQSAPKSDGDKTIYD